MRKKNLTRAAVALLIVSSALLTACEVLPLAGGLAGGGAGLTRLLIVLLGSTATTQPGCDVEDEPPTDMGVIDVGPCLSIPPPLPEDMGQDAYIGPCLSIVPEDMGQDTGVQPPSDMSPDMEEPDIGPCLSPPAPDMDMSALELPVDGATAPGQPKGRGEILARMRDRLPADVLASLEGEDDDQGRG